MSKPTFPKAETESANPCPECPVKLWLTLHDPNNIEAERQIRADQARLDQRRLDAKDREIVKLNNRIEVLQSEVRRLRAKAS